MIIILLACSSSADSIPDTPCAQTCAYISSDCDRSELANKWYDCAGEPSGKEEEACRARDPIADCIAECERVDHGSAWYDCMVDHRDDDTDATMACASVMRNCGYAPCAYVDPPAYGGYGCVDE